MDKASISDAPMIEFQKVTDYILAFWGIVDDQLEDENTRNIIKVGKLVERIDLYGRLQVAKVDMCREVARLVGRIPRCAIHFDQHNLQKISALVQADKLDYPAIVQTIDNLLLEE